MQYRKKLFLIGKGGAVNDGRRPEEIFKYRVSEMPFPGLWGRFDRILMVRKQRFSMSKFTICLQFSSTNIQVSSNINLIQRVIIDDSPDSTKRNLFFSKSNFKAFISRQFTQLYDNC